MCQFLKHPQVMFQTLPSLVLDEKDLATKRSGVYDKIMHDFRQDLLGSSFPSTTSKIDSEGLYLTPMNFAFLWNVRL